MALPEEKEEKVVVDFGNDVRVGGWAAFRMDVLRVLFLFAGVVVVAWVVGVLPWTLGMIGFFV